MGNGFPIEKINTILSLQSIGIDNGFLKLMKYAKGIAHGFMAFKGVSKGNRS